MEVGDQAVNRFKRIAGINEDIRIFMTFAELSVFAHDRFQRSAAGRADRNDPPAFRFGLVEAASRCLIHHEEFRMHVMIGDILGVHRTECTQADMQRDVFNFDAHGL